MVDLTEDLHRYRDCARFLWNVFLRPSADADSVEVFDSVRELLFAEIVLGKIGVADYRRQALQPIEFLLVKPQFDGTSILVQRSGGGHTRYWDDPTNSVGIEEAKLAFVDFFDWDQFSYRDFKFVLVTVVDWERKPNLVGRLALLEATQVTVFSSRDNVD
jgi:hypothetical protein